jgi:hypothetical protein
MAHAADPMVVRSATAKVTAVWRDYGKKCETKKTKLMQALVATHFVDRMGVIDMYNNQAASAASCWTHRKGSAVTQKELDAEHAEFETVAFLKNTSVGQTQKRLIFVAPCSGS